MNSGELGQVATGGYYYLHQNGKLIHKDEFGRGPEDFLESDMVVQFWPINHKDRQSAWDIIVEAGALGAEPVRVEQLAHKWGCTDEDADVYAKLVNCVLMKDGDMWCATRNDFINLQESPAGFGKTKREAMAELAKELGFVADKINKKSFRDLLK